MILSPHARHIARVEYLIQSPPPLRKGCTSIFTTHKWETGLEKRDGFFQVYTIDAWISFSFQKPPVLFPL